MIVTGAPPLQNSRGVGRPCRSKSPPIGPYCQPVSQTVVADLALIIVDPRGRRASFDGNASLLALLCTPSCRNTPGGPHRTVPLSRDTVAAEEAAHLVAAVAHLVVAAAHLVAAVMVGTGTCPHSRRAAFCGAQPHSGCRRKFRARRCLERGGRLEIDLGCTAGGSAPVPERGLAHQRERQQRSSAPDAGSGCR